MTTKEVSTPDHPTPQTYACIGTDKFVPAWKVRKEMGTIERQNAELLEALDDLQACAARALNNTMSMENRLALDLKVAIQRAAALARKQP